MSLDTCVKAEQFHVDLLRKASIYKRLQIVNSLVKTTRQLSWQGICERYPNETFESRVERFVSLLYNDNDLAYKVKKFLLSRNVKK